MSNPYTYTTTILKNGNFVFTAIAEKKANCNDTIKVSAKVNKVVGGIVTVEELEINDTTCFPNPFYTQPSLNAKDAHAVYNIPRVLIEKGLCDGSCQVVSRLNRGTYLLEFQHENQKERIEVMKQ